MNLFTLKTERLFFLLLLIIFSTPVLSQSVSISPSSTQTIYTGGAITFTALRVGGSTSWGNSSNSATYSYEWFVSGGSYTISGSNPESVSFGGNSSTKTITFNSTDVTYTIYCVLTRTSGAGTGIAATSSSVNVNVFTPNLYSTSASGTIKAYQINPILGTIENGPVDIFSPSGNTAGLGKNKVNTNDPGGYLYYVLNTTSNSGVVQIYSASATGSNDNLVGTIDMNGASDNTSLGFVRLGFDKNGTGWLIAGDGGSAVYIASFRGKGSNAIDNINTYGNVSLTVSGGSASDFQNGDLAITSSGVLYALANVTGGGTYVYTLNSLTNPTTLTKRWTVQTGGQPFTQNVNGVAWTSTGSMHISTSTGIYFLNQTTTNSGAATVQASYVANSPAGLTDLASAEFPAQTTLPVVYSSFSVKRNGANAELNWVTENEISNDYFVIERSTDAVHFQNAGTVKSKGNGSVQQLYTFIDPIGTSPVLYYRIKQVDVGTASTYSGIVSLKNNNINIAMVNLYPNPFVSDIKIQVRSDKKTEMIVAISNMAGQKVFAKKYSLEKGDNILVLTGIESLKPGAYSVEMSTDAWKYVQRVTK